MHKILTLFLFPFLAMYGIQCLQSNVAFGVELEDVIQFEVQSIQPQNQGIELKLFTKDNFKIYQENLSFELATTNTLPEYLTYQAAPKAKLILDPFSNTKKSVFETNTSFSFRVNSQIQNNSKIVVSVQGCSNDVCLLPGQLEIPVELYAKSSGVQKSSVFSAPEKPVENKQSEPELQKTTSNLNLSPHSIESSLSDITLNILQTGGLLLFPLLFLAGLLTNLTPCVYPMIPITIGVMNRFSQNERSKFRLAFAYFLGMVVTYSLLGVIAAMTGQIFGSQLASPIFSIVIAGIMILLGFAMLDFFDLSFLQRLSNKMPFAEKNPVLALSTMGALSGLVAAPCTGPILSMILVLIAQTRNPLSGFIYMLCFSIGFGAPYIVLGLVSQKLTQLPKMHRLSSIIKLIFACLMFALALYFLKGMLKDISIFNFFYTKPDLSSALAVIILLLLSTGVRHPKFQFFSKFSHLGIVALLTLLCLWFTLWISNAFIAPKQAHHSATFEEMLKTSQINWQTDLKLATQYAHEQNKKILVDVWAEWCTACLEMEATTWKDAHIIQTMKNKFIAVKLDYTHPSQSLSDQLSAWKIVGLPAVLILDPKQDNKPLEVNQGIIVTKDLLQKLSAY